MKAGIALFAAGFTFTLLLGCKETSVKAEVSDKAHTMMVTLLNGTFSRSCIAENKELVKGQKQHNESKIKALEEKARGICPVLPNDDTDDCYTLIGQLQSYCPTNYDLLVTEGRVYIIQ